VHYFQKKRVPPVAERKKIEMKEGRKRKAMKSSSVCHKISLDALAFPGEKEARPSSPGRGGVSLLKKGRKTTKRLARSSYKKTLITVPQNEGKKRSLLTIIEEKLKEKEKKMP